MEVGRRTKWGTVIQVLSTAKVLHEGWEMDNEAWAVLTDKGIFVLSTNHGGLVEFTDLDERIRETAESLRGLQSLALIARRAHQTLTTPPR
jgi:hypothetical protein